MTPFPPTLAPIIIPPVRGIRDHRPHLKPAAPITDTTEAQRYGLPQRYDDLLKPVGMVNFINHSPDTVLEELGDYALTHGGILETPQTRRDMDRVVGLGFRWALDNGFYSNPDDAALMETLERLQHLPRCTFAVVPDVVANHDGTMTLFRKWIDTYHRLGYAPAFVLQNGVTVDSVPYADIAAVFIGGNDTFHLNEDVLQPLVDEAKRRGLWVHYGRVNSVKRINMALRLGCDSFDGTGYSKFSKSTIRKHHAAHTFARQVPLFPPAQYPSCVFTIPIPPAPLMLTAPKIAGYLPCPAT